MTANAEYKLHVAIVELLNRTKVPVVLFWHTPNGGSRNKIEAAKLKRMGVLPGVPDLIIIMPNGKMIFMEVKAPGGRITKEQRDFLTHESLLRHAGFVVCSLDDAIDVLTSCGAIRSGVSVAA